MYWSKDSVVWFCLVEKLHRDFGNSFLTNPDEQTAWISNCLTWFVGLLLERGSANPLAAQRHLSVAWSQPAYMQLHQRIPDR